jgi:hypothetical protein
MARRGLTALADAAVAPLEAALLPAADEPAALDPNPRAEPAPIGVVCIMRTGGWDRGTVDTGPQQERKTAASHEPSFHHSGVLAMRNPEYAEEAGRGRIAHVSTRLDRVVLVRSFAQLAHLSTCRSATSVGARPVLQPDRVSLQRIRTRLIFCTVTSASPLQTFAIDHAGRTNRCPPEPTRPNTV